MLLRQILLRPFSIFTFCALFSAALSSGQQAQAHPHVFAEARLEMSIDDKGEVKQLAHVWRFDDMFSSTVMMEFDANGDLKLDDQELARLSQTINSSIAEFKYFQTIEYDGKEVKMVAPNDLKAAMIDGRLMIVFTSKPQQPMVLAAGHKASFGVYDPTFYTAIDYVKDEDMVVADLPEGCRSKVIRPNPDEAIAQNQSNLTDAFFKDPSGNDLSKLLATRLEIDCGAQ